jgi:hypothetical protein
MKRILLICMLAALLPACANIHEQLGKFSASLHTFSKQASQHTSEEALPGETEIAESIKSLLQKTYANSFFADLLGVDEDTFQQPENLKKNILKQQDGTFIVKSMHPNPVWYKAGAFKAWSIQEVRDEMVKREKDGSLKKSNKPGTFNILGPKVGVGELQTSGKNKHPVVMVASNFNAVVDIGASMLEVTHYPNDPTQEQRATMAGLPGILLRYFYGCYSATEPDPKKWRQLPDSNFFDSGTLKNIEQSQQIHLLTGPGIQVKDGYVKFVPTKALADAFDAETIANQIGYHRDIQVLLSGTDKSGAYGILKDPTKLVDHVMVAALPLSEMFGAYHNDPSLQRITQKVLNNAYEGTIRAAILHGRKRIFLTWLGGGAFGNPKDMIAKAIAQDVIKQLVADYGLEVFLVDWSGDYASHPVLVGWLVSSKGAQYKKLTELPQEA